MSVMNTEVGGQGAPKSRTRKDVIKNVAIVFLAVLLVLTFCSNTIMNISLPEVSAEYVRSSPINTQVRGTGTVLADKEYTVSAATGMKIEEVLVRVGDYVSKGDVLFTIEAKQSDELTEARATLDNMEYDYEVKLLNRQLAALSGSTAGKNVEMLQGEIDKLRADLAKLSTDAAMLADPAAYIKTAEANIASLETQIADLEAQIASSGEGSENSAESLRSNAKALEGELDQMLVDYRGQYDIDNAEAWEMTISAYKQQLMSDYNEMISDPAKYDEGKIAAIRAIKNKQSEVEVAWDAYYRAADKESAGSLETLTTLLAMANSRKSATEDKLEAARQAQTIQADIADKQESLAEAKKELSREYQSQVITDKLNAMADAREEEAIEQQRKIVEELEAKGSQTEVTATSAGTVSNVSVVSGQSVEVGTTLAVISISDLGYTVSFPVTLAQASKISKGAEATVENWWWSNLTATVEEIRVDVNNPSQSRIVVCRIMGEVSDGQQLTLSVGQRSSSYAYTVPNSAVREDNNGKYVLVVTDKPSPLSTRYYASRMDVEVVATDDARSALSGAFTGGEFVITTASTPVSSGSQVRLAD